MRDINHRYFSLSLTYLLLHTILCSTLLYLLVQNFRQANSTTALVLFGVANLLFALLLLSPKILLRLPWAVAIFLLLYLLAQGFSDFWASRAESGQAIITLYHILQARISIILALLFLLSSALAIRFGKYRSIEATALLPLTFILLTRDELSSSFEDRYYLYRMLWLSMPILNLVLLGLTLHPGLRGENSWLAPVPAQKKQSPQSRRTVLIRRLRQTGSFATLLLVLMALLWWGKISPINWQTAARDSTSGNGLLQKNLNNQFDFGEYLQLDSSLEQDRQLVMMSQIADLPKDRPSYLKRFTLSGLAAGRSFFRDPQEPNMPGESPLPLELERGISLFEMPQYHLRRNREMYVFLLNIKPSSLFVLNHPTEIQTFENWPDSSFSRVYRVKAQTLVRAENHFFGTARLSSYLGKISKERLDYYTYLPKEFADIGDFARAVLSHYLPSQTASQTASLGTLQPLEAARQITDYFHREYRYTLKPGIAQDGDQLRHFLFKGKKGYCTYFAFSAGLMLRSLGIPTRVAVGFLLNPELRILDYYPLFADQAHAWLEVFEPQQGWVIFDPTTFELAPGENLRFGLPEGAEADLAALTEELLRNNALNAEAGRKLLKPEASPAQLLLSRLWKAVQQRSWLLFVLFIVLLLLVLLGYRAHLLALALHSPPRNNPKAIRAIVTAMYHYLQLLNTRLLTQIGTRPPATEAAPAADPLRKFPPRQLHAWQNALYALPPVAGHLAQPQQQLLLHHSKVCLGLFQKYYFSAHFTAEDTLQLRAYLQELNQAKAGHAIKYQIKYETWHLPYLIRSLYRFIRQRNRNWK